MLHRFQLRILMRPHMQCPAEQLLTGVLKMNVHQRQSYFITAELHTEVQIDTRSSFRSESHGFCDLKETFYRYLQPNYAQQQQQFQQYQQHQLQQSRLDTCTITPSRTSAISDESAMQTEGGTKEVCSQRLHYTHHAVLLTFAPTAFLRCTFVAVTAEGLRCFHPVLPGSFRVVSEIGHCGTTQVRRRRV